MKPTRGPKQNKTPEYVVVYTSMGPLAAEVVKGRLESAGIPALLKYESVGRIYGLTLDGLGEVQVLVSKDREKEARALITQVG
ncbi:MAG: DUF2007 domain-containing protein [Acidobacteriota bacterium]